MNLLKKNLFNLAVAANLLITPNWAHAQAGDRGGNGGDGMIAEFEYNAEQIGKWVNRGNLKKIKLENVDPAALEQALLVQVQRILNHEVKLSFVKSDLAIQDSQGQSVTRTCKNYPALKKVDCNIGKWGSETPQSRYTLVMHELLGLAGFEENDGVHSEYRISRQLMPYVTPQTNYILSDSVNEEADLVPFIHCEGKFKPVKNWSLRHHKKVIVNFFPNDQKIYTTELLYSLGATNMREVTGGPRGHRTFRSTGVDKIARYFNSGNPTSTVLPQFHNVGSYNNVEFFLLKIFGESMYFTPSQGANGIGFLGGLPGSGTGISMRCEYDKLDRSELAQLRQFVDQLSKRGPVPYTMDEQMADFEFMTKTFKNGYPTIPRGYQD